MARKLTLKQTRFIKEYLKDGNATQAVRVAYPNIRTAGARRVMANKLVTNGNVTQYIKAICEHEGITEEYIVRGLKELTNDENKDLRHKVFRTLAEIMGYIGRGVSLNQVNVGEGVITQEALEEIRLSLLRPRANLRNYSESRAL